MTISEIKEVIEILKGVNRKIMTISEIKEVIEILKKEGCNSKKQAIEYLEGKLNMKEKERMKEMK